MTNVKSFRIEDILVGNGRQNIAGEKPESPSSTVIRHPSDKVQRKAEEKEYCGNMRLGANEDRKSTTSDSGNSSRASTPTLDRVVSQQFPKKSQAGSDQRHGTSRSFEYTNLSCASTNEVGGPLGIYTYPHPRFALMFPMSREEKVYTASPNVLPFAAATGLMDPFIPKSGSIFGGRPHPSLMSLPPVAGMDYSSYSHHHSIFPGALYGFPLDEGSQQSKPHLQHQVITDRVNYPSSMFQLNRPTNTSPAMYSVACKRKGGQIRFTNSQTSQLEKAFVQQKYLNANDRKKLAQSLGLSDRQVKTWFQNRRAKLRKCKGGVCEESEITGSPQDIADS